MAKCATCGRDLGFMTHRYKVDGQLYCDDDYKTIQAKLEELRAKGNAIITVVMTNEELRDGINESFKRVEERETDIATRWAKKLNWLADPWDIVTSEMLKVLVEENKILIRQNELILRALTANQRDKHESSQATA